LETSPTVCLGQQRLNLVDLGLAKATERAPDLVAQVPVQPHDALLSRLPHILQGMLEASSCEIQRALQVIGHYVLNLTQNSCESLIPSNYQFV